MLQTKELDMSHEQVEAMMKVLEAAEQVSYFQSLPQ
jgi:hypothetical protein